MPAISEINISQRHITQFSTEGMPSVYKEHIAKRKAAKPKQAFSSLGLAIPFQPSMWDEKSIKLVWSNVIEMVKTKLKSRYSEESSSEILSRLEKLFPKLNCNTLRKSLAIILTPAEEKIIYLSFPVKPVIFLNKSVSFLDLAANMQQEADFYHFVFNEDSVSLYDYNKNQLHKIFEQVDESGSVNLFKNASAVIKLMNSNCEKPVFVTGRPNKVEGFCKSSSYAKQFFTFLYHSSPFSNELIQSCANEISTHWSYWHSKFTKGKILLAQKAGTYTANIDAVLKALGKCTNGLLLVDKKLKHQLQKSNSAGVYFQLETEFMQQLEKFLARGNRIEITETGLLKDMGGIVLLHNSAPVSSGGSSDNRDFEIEGVDSFF